MAKKKSIIIFIIVLILGIIFSLYHCSFPIGNDLENVEVDEYIIEWLNRGEESRQDIQIHTPITIGNLNYYPIEFDAMFGYILLKKGLTNRYKVDHMRAGTPNNFRSGVIEEQDEKYLIMLGRNVDYQINKIEIKPDGYSIYDLLIPKQDVFINFIKVNDNTPTGNVDAKCAEFFNQNDENITSTLKIIGFSEIYRDNAMVKWL